MQRRLRGGIGGALDNEEIVSQLALGQRDIDALKAKAEKAEEAFRDQVAALRREMQADLLKALSPAQQAKYQDLVGDPFEFAADERTNFGQGGQPGGGRQGGGRPGGGTRGQRPTQ